MEYVFTGYTTDMKVIKGKIYADSEQAATTLLSNQGYNILNLQPIQQLKANIVLFRSKVSSNEIVTFSRQLALLLESGIGIVRCLELLSDQSSVAEMKRVLKDVILELRAGSTMAEAMAKHPHAFPRMYSRLIEVGERTGSLDTVLRNLADYAEKESRALSKVKTALAYPIIVGVLAIVVGLVMVLFLLPPIVAMFSSLGGTLPLITRILIAGVDFLTGNIIQIGAVVLVVVLIFMVYVRTPAGNLSWNRLKLKIPLMGRISHVSELAKLCRSMSLLFKAGLPLNEIINLGAQGCGNKAIAQALLDVGQDAMEGKGLARPMSQRSVFLPLMTELAAVGEETGTLEQTLAMIAENFETEADIKTQRLLSMIEPVMTIAMGIAVGFLAISIFLPLYQSLSLIK
jgi:type IV pilus assembly protein PilC